MAALRTTAKTYATVDALVEQLSVSEAVSLIRAEDDATIERQIELSEIPAPPFEEAERGVRVAELLAQCRLEVSTDEVGNVIGRPPGRSERPFVVSAHLDTVFPAGTDVRVTRKDDRLLGPGISDDARGLTSLLTLARVWARTGLETVHPVWFVATVGEEGQGDLRGVKHLFREAGTARDACGFVSLDGAGLTRVVTRGLGSRRFRISALGPGGHSWVDRGTANPIHALAPVIQGLNSIDLPEDPASALTVARMGGGKSINAIPQVGWIEIDTRSESQGELDRIESAVRRTVSGADGATSGLTFEITSIGTRPAAETPTEAHLVQCAFEATRSLGIEPVSAISSTDANIPMSLGCPAITLGCGGEAGKAHTTDEWFKNVRGPDGIIRALYTLLLAAGPVA